MSFCKENRLTSPPNIQVPQRFPLPQLGCVLASLLLRMLMMSLRTQGSAGKRSLQTVCQQFIPEAPSDCW